MGKMSIHLLNRKIDVMLKLIDLVINTKFDFIQTAFRTNVIGVNVDYNITKKLQNIKKLFYPYYPENDIKKGKYKMIY